MSVVLDSVGNIVVDDKGDISDIESSRSDVGGDQNSLSAFLEIFDGSVSHNLSFVSMDADSVEGFLIQQVLKLVTSLLCLAEDENLIVTSEGIQVVDKPLKLFSFRDNFVNLLDVFVEGGVIVVSELDMYGLFMAEIVGELPDFSGPGGSEHHGLSVWSDLADDFSDLWLKSHIQHSVSLIQNEVGYSAQVSGTFLEEVDESSWGGNNHV